MKIRYQPQTELNSILEKHGIKYPRCGAQCGPGWYPIIERLIVKLKALGWDLELDQIKEKFGGLRFYIGGYTPGMDQAIAEAEKESFRTCEDCGAEGKPRKGGWIRTLCDTCDAARKVKP